MSEILTEKKNHIPEISDQKLQELCERIKPVIRFARGPKGLFRSREGYAYYIDPVDPRSIAFTWDPKPTKRATWLQSLCDITTYHTYNYYGLFKPSIAQVIAQIPEEHIDKVVAFEIIICPETSADLNDYNKELNEGYHVATTRLYIPFTVS